MWCKLFHGNRWHNFWFNFLGGVSGVCKKCNKDKFSDVYDSSVY